jgi:hypothetical protein
MSQEQHNEQAEQRPVIKLKPTGFDIVLETVAGLMILAMWGLVIVSWLSPERFLWASDLPIALAFSLFAIFYYYQVRFSTPKIGSGFFIKITEENAERQSRLAATSQRLFFIWICSLLISTRILKFWPFEVRESFRHVVADFGFGLMLCVFIWCCIRSWQLR